MNPAPESPETTRQRRVWNNAADRYDRQIAWFERTFLDDGRAWLGGRAQGRTLEVAVGTGRSFVHYPAEIELTGVDLSPAMLNQARAEASRLGRAVDLQEADAEALPFPDGSFDTVVCALALCSIPSPGRAVAEFDRVLVRGGRLLLLDHVVSTWWPLKLAQRMLELATIRGAGEHFTRRQFPVVEAAGFTVIEADRLKAGIIERLHAVKAHVSPHRTD